MTGVCQIDTTEKRQLKDLQWPNRDNLSKKEKKNIKSHWIIT